MKPPKEIYDKIPELPESGFYMHFGGVYCRNCGETFALYSYSAIRPSGIDENRKPYYSQCFKCPTEKS